MQTGFPRADAQDDFERALREARLARLGGWLSGRTSGDRLPVLGEGRVWATVTEVRPSRRETPAAD